MKTIFRKIKRRGLIHTLETTFNRFVPAWLFRFSVGDVLQLDVQKLCHLADDLDSNSYISQCVEDPASRNKLRTITWNSVPLSTSKNDFGYAIYHRDNPAKVVGGVWGGVDSFLEADLGFQIQLEDDQAWIYCAFVSKDVRGGGVYQRVLSYAARDLKRRGYHRLRVVIQPWNKASMYIHRKYSVSTIGRIAVVRVFGIAAVFCTGQLAKDRTTTRQFHSNPVLIQVP